MVTMEELKLKFPSSPDPPKNKEERIKYIKYLKNLLTGIGKVNCINNMDEECLEPTSESQGHGKAFEIEIQKKCFEMTDEMLNTYTHVDKYDIREEHNKINKQNESIKASCNNIIDCGDIIRFLTSENMDIICIIYKQDGEMKVAIKTIVFKFEDFIKILKKDVEKYCGEDWDTWFQKIKTYDSYVKSIPNGLCQDKSYKQMKHPLCKKIPYFNIAPKVDSKKQRRVQCSINLKKLELLVDIKTFDGGRLYDKEYCKQIKSCKRDRQKKHI